MSDDTEMPASEAQLWDTYSDDTMPAASQNQAEYERVYAEVPDDLWPSTQVYTATSIRTSHGRSGPTSPLDLRFIPNHRLHPATFTFTAKPWATNQRDSPSRIIIFDAASNVFKSSSTAAIPRYHRSSTHITPITPVKTDSGRMNASPHVMPAVVPQRAALVAGSSRNLTGTAHKRPAPPPDYPARKIPRTDSAPVTSSSVKATKPLTSNSTAPPGALAAGKPFSLARMFHGLHGRQLKPFVISHSDEVQKLFDDKEIARGVQWELVRGILMGRWDWEAVKDKVGNLAGTNAKVAPRIDEIMLGSPSHNGSRHEMSLWEELDREAKATAENPGRGLGLMGEFEGKADWYGGQVQCTLRLIHTGENTEPSVRLEALQMTRSTHLARDLGSLSVISLHDDQKGAVIKEWATRKFILCGRTYVALPPKAGKVYMIETDEDHGRTGRRWCGDEHRISFDAYLRRNNPLELNGQQPFAKYSTRFSLYLSTSIPVIEFDAERVILTLLCRRRRMDEGTNPPTETIMTDGCGFINRAAVLKICVQMKYERPPVAFQGRIAGSKGMWLVHPDDESPEPMIWVRDSQRKIRFQADQSLRRSHRIFDLLSAPGPSSSLTLSAQAITILAHNGVPATVFCSLQEQGLKDLIMPLIQWGPGPYAPAYLWNAINTVSKVTRVRLQTLASGASRALGFEKRPFREDEHHEEAVEEGMDLPQNTTVNVLSGEPLTCAEAALQLLQAGFDPLYTPFLSRKIENVIHNAMESYLTRYKIPVKHSFEAYIIPDPTGQLQKGEVFYRSSVDLDTPLRQDVVVGRYPMREPSDMQKVTAVDIPALAQYVDVLVTSIHGDRSLASLLAGGDMDGDEAIIIGDPDIVTPFQNQPFVPVPEGFLETNFERQVKKVADFGQELAKMDVATAQRAFQGEVLAGLVDSFVGRYSYFHDFAVYEHGLDHADTRRIAHMTSTLLDASKTGLQLLDAVHKTDQTQFGGQRPACFGGGRKTKRPRKLGPFVLDSLLKEGGTVKDALLEEFNVVASHVGSKKSPDPDADVREVYIRAKELAKTRPAIAADLKLIKEWMEKLCADYRAKLPTPNQPGVPGSGNKEKDRRKKGPARMSDNMMLPVMQEYRRSIDGKFQHFDERDLDDIKASCAFTLSPSFAVSMAFQNVCELKRRAEIKRGAHNRVTVIDEFKSVGREAKRLLERYGHGAS
ncbi:RNA dependent RNA polymerase-domain-containing protein [Roridomyces roridus]|uniref:RNA-dependent RNA polymerase n=1 Tax=Roridomyces roridus TaxID=1738132 RepID=A0AAD7FZQ8_9AGAR|nr:RNA dependent RNA polymerase-domain-containing protein [Roridomyces roridus]